MLLVVVVGLDRCCLCDNEAEAGRLAFFLSFNSTDDDEEISKKLWV